MGISTIRWMHLGERLQEKHRKSFTAIDQRNIVNDLPRDSVLLQVGVGAEEGQEGIK